MMMEKCPFYDELICKHTPIQINICQINQARKENSQLKVSKK